MSGPSGLHIARFAYYDSTGFFNPDQVEGLPPGFVISRRYLDPTQAVREIGLTPQIAMGAHGYGDLITRPFVLVAIACDNISLGKLIGELKPIADEYDGEVIVDGFMAPSDLGVYVR